jgi:toxin ParE1/3/4
VGSIRLTPLAEQDLRDIWQHGTEVWGRAQAERYFDAMYGTFELIADFPEIARLRDNFTPPIRLHPFQSHLIAYDAGKDGVDVIRILHMRSDILALLDS